MFAVILKPYDRWELEDIFRAEVKAGRAKALEPHVCCGFPFWRGQAYRAVRQEGKTMNEPFTKCGVQFKSVQQLLDDPSCKYIPFSFCLKKHVGPKGGSYQPKHLRNKQPDEIYKILFESPAGMGTAVRRVHEACAGNHDNAENGAN